MKQFLAKAFFVLISLISGYITSYYLIQFTCANQSPLYTRQYGPPSDLQLCVYKATLPAAVTGLLVGLIVLYIFLKIIFKYSLKSYGIFLLKFILFIAINWGLMMLLYLPINDIFCRLTQPKLELSNDGRVIPGIPWGVCWEAVFLIKVYATSGLISTMLTTVGYFFLNKWRHKKKKS